MQAWDLGFRDCRASGLGCKALSSRLMQPRVQVAGASKYGTLSGGRAFGFRGEGLSQINRA